MGILFILGMLTKKSKIIYYLQFFWIWIILSFCENMFRPDYQNYLRAFERYGTQKFEIINSEIGYAFTNKVLYAMGFDFNTANMIYVTFILILLFTTIPRYTKYITIPSSLYMLFPVFLNGIQIRSSISAAILIWSLKYLEDDDIVSTLKYVLCIIIATTFHSTSFIYLLLVFAKYWNTIRIRRLMILLVLSIMGLINIAAPWLRIIFGDQRYENKFLVGNNTRLETLMMCGWQFTLFIIILLMYNKKKKKYIVESQDTLILRINLLMLAILPLYYLDFSTERLIRGLMVINFCYAANFSEQLGIKCGKKAGMLEKILFASWFGISCIYFEGLHSHRLQNVVMVYLNENQVFNQPMNYIFLLFAIAFIGIVLFVFSNVKIRIKKIEIR